MEIDPNELERNPEFEHFLPALTEEEYSRLEENIVKIGYLTDPILIWKGHNTIIDGHNRFQIFNKLGIPLKIQEVEFEDGEAVKLFMIEHQMGRRNLFPFQRIELALKMEKIYEEKAKANQSAGGGSVKQKSAQPIKTREEVARVAGVSHNTLAKAKRIIEEADETAIKNLRTGRVKINSVYKKLEGQIAHHKEDVDPQEKKIVSWIEDIVNKMSKFAKIRDEVPEKLREQAKGKIIPLINQIFGS